MSNKAGAKHQSAYECFKRVRDQGMSLSSASRFELLAKNKRQSKYAAWEGDRLSGMATSTRNADGLMIDLEWRPNKETA